MKAYKAMVVFVVSMQLLASASMTFAAPANGDLVETPNLSDLFVFGEGLSPVQRQQSGASSDYFRDPFTPDPSLVPSWWRPEAYAEGEEKWAGGNIDGGGSVFGDPSTQASVLGRASVSTRALDDPSGQPNGVSSTGSEYASQGFSGVALGNNPLLEFQEGINSPAISEGMNAFDSYAFALSMSVLMTDPGAAAANSYVNQQYGDLIRNSNLSLSELRANNQRLGSEGIAQEFSQDGCNIMAINAGLSTLEARLACQRGAGTLAMRGTRSATATGALRSGRSGSNIVLRDDPVPPSDVEVARRNCGAWVDDMSIPGEARCIDVPTKQYGNGSAYSSVRLSHILFPQALPDSTATNEQRATAAKQKQNLIQYFGDTCLVCAYGGTFVSGAAPGSPRPNGVVELVKIIQPPIDPPSLRYVETEEAIYENLRKIIHSKCYSDSADLTSGTTGGSPFEQTAEGIFRMDKQGNPTSLTWDDGNFWRGERANLNSLPTPWAAKSYNVFKALDMLSYSGFRLTPSIIDALYWVVTEKDSVAGRTAQVIGPGLYTNEECDSRFKEFKNSWKYVRLVMDEKNFDTSKRTSQHDLPREIKGLYFIAQRLAVGKMFDACDEVAGIATASPLLAMFSQDIFRVIENSCRGVASRPEQYGFIKGDNTSRLNQFVDRMFQQIASSSGKSGSSLAKSVGVQKEAAANSPK